MINLIGTISRFQRLARLLSTDPGPLAQAITFRAVGAEALVLLQPVPLQNPMMPSSQSFLIMRKLSASRNGQIDRID